MGRDLLSDLLKEVSRSFYLSLAVLPPELREPLGLGYALARAADTVADTRVLPRAERLVHLRTLRAAYLGEPADLDGVVRACSPHQGTPGERRLMEHLALAVARLEALPAQDRHELRVLLVTLTAGMIFDLTRFPGDDASALAALETLDELDHYTYLVAGCVGPCWTALHAAHRPRLRGWDRPAMRARAVRFGKALQLTNVLRDVPADLRHGRCYLPARELRALDLAPHDLLDPALAPRARPLLQRLLHIALQHYEVAWEYTLAVPRAEWRTRLACAWPLLIGLATLRAVAHHPDPLSADPPVKIARAEVRRLLGRSLVTVWSDRALAAEAERLRRTIPV